MLGEHAIGYVGGAGSCAGCGEATAIRMLVAATRQVHGPESMGIVAATGCNTVFGSTYPFNPYLVPWTNSLFENAPAVALGIRARWDQDGPPGAQAVGHRRRRRDVRHRLPGPVADGRLGGRHQGPRPRHAGLLEHRWPGVDRVVRRPGHQALGVRQGDPRPARAAQGARPDPRWPTANAYVAQTTPAHINHFYRAVMEANAYPGPAVVIAYSPCQPEHGIADDASTAPGQAGGRVAGVPAVHLRPAARASGCPSAGRCRATRPSASDWATRPGRDVVDFLAFARTEGRFAAHFAADDLPSPEIVATQADRLANWHMLQELAGLR